MYISLADPDRFVKSGPDPTPTIRHIKCMLHNAHNPIDNLVYLSYSWVLVWSHNKMKTAWVALKNQFNFLGSPSAYTSSSTGWYLWRKLFIHSYTVSPFVPYHHSPLLWIISSWENLKQGKIQLSTCFKATVSLNYSDCSFAYRHLTVIFVYFTVPELELLK